MTLTRITYLLVVTTLISLVAWPAKAETSHSPTVIDQDAYWQFVQDTQDTLSQLQEHPENEIHLTLVELADQWEAITEIDVDGQIIPVDNTYLVRLMRSSSPDIEQIDGILTTLITAHQSFPAHVYSSKDIDPLHKILSQPEFSWSKPEPNPVNEWFQQLWDRFNRWLNDLLGDEPMTISVPTNLLTTLSTLLLVIVLIFIFSTLFGDFAQESKINSENGEEDEIITSKTAFAKAQKLSRKGDYRSAVRYLYLSALLIMDERGVLRYDRSKTNREYLRSVTDSPDLAEPLEEVIEVFDDVWYGYHDLDEDTFKRYSNHVEELKEKKG